MEGLAEWRLKESQELGQIVQNRLENFQVGRGGLLVGAGLKNDLFTLSDGVDGLAEWRLEESQELGQIVQNRLEYLQVGGGSIQDFSINVLKFRTLFSIFYQIKC